MSYLAAVDWTDLLARDGEPVEEAHQRLYRLGLIDGLPIVPPTAAAVRRMYREAGLDPVRLVATPEPALRPASVYDVAVCAVLAGCAPRHLPIVCAALHAAAQPAFNLLGIQTTTGSAAPAIAVSGPAAGAAGVSGGPDCLGGSVHANAVIGRALRLALRILGGASPGGMDAATMGQPAKVGLCFAENADASPWPPFHVERGFAAGDGVVTVAGISGTVEVVFGESAEPEEIVQTMARSMTIAGSLGSGGVLGGAPLVLLSPEHANTLAGSGMTREAVRRRLWDLATLPLDDLAPSAAARVRATRRDDGIADVHAPVRVAVGPAGILVIVAGGAGVKSTYAPGWGGGTRPVSIRVDGW